MVKLVCAIVGVAGSAFPVDVDASQLVGDLKKAIKDENANDLKDVDAKNLQLFLAKTEGGAWLESDSEDVKKLKKGEKTGAVEALTSEDKELQGESGLQKVLTGMPQPSTDEIHVLVVVSPATVKRKADELLESAVKKPKQQVTWKQIDEPVFSVDESKLFFVNRDRTVEALAHIHYRNCNRATNGGGLEWRIPIVDHVYGLGKTTFALNYIRECRKMFAVSEEFNSEFREKLSKCHTLCIQFAGGELADETTWDAVVIKRLIGALNNSFLVPPAVLSNVPETARDFVEQLANDAGPVFIVLDEIGRAFALPGLDDVECRERFMNFCSMILMGWLDLKDVFFLLVGRGSFLSIVGERPNGEHLTKHSPCEFARLPLNLLRPAKIVELISNTRVSKKSQEFVRDQWNLTDAGEVQQAARLLFQKTCGHPRSLAGALVACSSVESLRTYHCDPVDPGRRDELQEKMLIYQNVLTEVAPSIVDSEDATTNASTCNLTKTYKDDGGRDVPYDHILDRCGLAWEGKLTEARVYAHQSILLLVFQSVFPFREYIKKLGMMLSRGVSPNYPDAFEWMCLKRFQEMFSVAKQPERVAHGFFSACVKFKGDLQFPTRACRLPKITKNGKQNPTLQSKTACPMSWSILMRHIHEQYFPQSASKQSVCFKPDPASASSDVIFMVDVGSGNDCHILTVGLAVKNYGAPITMKVLTEECEKFDRMFDEHEEGQKVSSARHFGRTNVLIVCGTNYCARLQEVFDNKKSTVVSRDSLPPSPINPLEASSSNANLMRTLARDLNLRSSHIDELVLLDLSTPENRAAFFDVEASSESKQTIEAIIAKPATERQ